MGKSKKTKNSLHVSSAPRVGGIRFELEDDAHDLMLDYLAQMPSDIASLKEPAAATSTQPTPSRSRSARPAFLLDLHGCSLAEAETETQQYIEGLLRRSRGPFTLKVITGRGLHSGEAGSILVREIYRFILTTFRANIAKIDSPPAESIINGLPLRGFFLVHFTSSLRRK